MASLAIRAAIVGGSALAAFLWDQFTKMPSQLSEYSPLTVIRISRNENFFLCGTFTNALTEEKAVVAIKLINVTNSLMERIESEIDLRKLIDHENHVKCLHTFQDNYRGLPYQVIVMENIDGDDLSTWVSQTLNNIGSPKSQLSAKDISSVFTQTAGAVNYLHNRVYVHRQLNPSNIMVTRKGKVKLIGLSSCRKIRAPLYEHCPNGLYEAPELVARCQYTLNVDIWALGCILYKLFMQHSPFNSARDIRNGDYKQVPKGREPRQLAACIDACLHPDPSKRPTADELWTTSKMVNRIYDTPRN